MARSRGDPGTGSASPNEARGKTTDAPGEETIRLGLDDLEARVEAHRADPLVGVPGGSDRQGLAREPAPSQVLRNPLVVVAVHVAEKSPDALGRRRESDRAGERDHDSAGTGAGSLRPDIEPLTASRIISATAAGSSLIGTCPTPGSSTSRAVAILCSSRRPWRGRRSRSRVPQAIKTGQSISSNP